MAIAQIVAYCADVGSIPGRKFGWARGDPSAGPVEEHRGGEEIIDLVDAVTGDLCSGRPVALGFECPLFVPVPEDPLRLGRARAGERDRAWSAGAGTGALATGLVQSAWILAEIRERVKSVPLALDWPTFVHQGRGLFLWEAFVSGSAKQATHVGDATVAVAAFVDALPEPLARNAVQESRVLSLIGAAALWSGLADDAGLLGTPCLVLRAAEPDTPPAEEVSA